MSYSLVKRQVFVESLSLAQYSALSTKSTSMQKAMHADLQANWLSTVMIQVLASSFRRLKSLGTLNVKPSKESQLRSKLFCPTWKLHRKLVSMTFTTFIKFTRTVKTMELMKIRSLLKTWKIKLCNGFQTLTLKLFHSKKVMNRAPSFLQKV